MEITLLISNNKYDIGRLKDYTYSKHDKVWHRCTLTNPFHCVQNVYDEFFLSTYNMLYTAAPVIMLGALEQDVTPTTALRYPGLYQPGLQHLWFSRKVFATYAIHGLITSLALIGVTMGKTKKTLCLHDMLRLTTNFFFITLFY